MSTKTVTLERIEELLVKISLGDKKVLTLEEASLYIGIKKSYLYKICSLRLIKYSKPLGKMSYFKKEHLNAWMLENEQKTKDTIEREAFLSINKKGHGE